MPPRDRLLDRCLRYFLKHGVANLSLRPLAASAKTSARMLLHHFGSKEELIAAVLQRVHAELQNSLQTIVRASPADDAAIVLENFWKLISARTNLAHLRLLFEVQVLAMQNPRRYSRYLAATSESWLRSIERALPAGKDRAASATLFTAVIDGLMLELLSTGDAVRAAKALRLFTKQLRKTSR